MEKLEPALLATLTVLYSPDLVKLFTVNKCKIHQCTNSRKLIKFL